MAASNERPLGIAFIGAGDISTLHIAGIKQCEGAKFIGLWNRAECPIVPDPAARAAAYGGRLFESAEALCTSPDVDAVLVLTNYETHLKYAKLAMDGGKHVLVEKPTAASVEEMEEMKAYAAKCNVHCMPVHNYVYEPSLWRTRQMIENGTLGSVHCIYVMYNIYHPEDVCARLPGVVRQIGTHHAYTVLYLLGKEDTPRQVSAFRSTLRDETTGVADDRENLAVITFTTARGAMVHMQFNFASDDHSSDAWSFYVKVIGSKGATRYSYNDWVQNAKTMVHSHTYEPYPHTIAATDAHFVERVLKRGEAPLSGLDQAVMAQKLLDAAEVSWTEGRHVTLEP
eukprot:m.54765 g.54765  ORF g.54765 m.54765 type:complete len:341 (+) comp7556_c0_seq2:343-1365(+)